MFMIEATARRLRRGRVAPLRGQRRQRLQQAGGEQVVEGHAPGLGCGAQRLRTRRADMQAGGKRCGRRRCAHGARARHGARRPPCAAGRAAPAAPSRDDAAARGGSPTSVSASASGASAASGCGQAAGQVGQQPGDRIAAGHVVVVDQRQLEGRACSSMAMKRNGCSCAAAAKGRLNSRSIVCTSSAGVRRRRAAARASSTSAGPPSKR